MLVFVLYMNVLSLETNGICIGNERLQEMMGQMAEQRGGKVFATDERYRTSFNTRSKQSSSSNNA